MALFAALIGPYFINWTSYRTNFEQEASRYFGQPVTVAGRADLRLLPTPVLSFTDVRLGDPEEPYVVVERFRAEVELTPLLKGEINVLDMTIERPTLQIDLAGLDQISTAELPEHNFDPEKIALNDVEIARGEALVLDSRTGRQWSVSNINAVIDAKSLAGPARIDAGLIFDGQPVTVRAATGRRAGDKAIPLNISISPARWPVTLIADGKLRIGEDGAPVYIAKAVITGQAAAKRASNGVTDPADAGPAGTDPAGGDTVAGGGTSIGDAPDDPDVTVDDFAGTGEPDASAGEPFGIAALRLLADIELTARQFTTDNLQVAYGPLERPLQLNGRADVAFAQDPQFEIALDARQINLDRIVGGGPSNPVSVGVALGVLREALTVMPAPSMPGTLSFRSDGVVIDGSVLEDASARLAADDGQWAVESASVELPGDARFETGGRLVPGETPKFEGWSRLDVKRPAAFAAWWRGEAGQSALIGPFSVAANIGFSEASRVADDIVAVTSEGTVRGMVAARNFAASDDVFIAIELEADRFDLDKGRAIVSLLGGEALASGRIDRISLDLRADELIAGGIVARAVTVEGDLEDNGLDLRRLSVADLAGARVEADGRIKDLFDTPNGRFDASLRADNLSGAATFVSSLLPQSEIASHFVQVAPGLAPVEADLSVRAGDPDQAIGLDLTGNFAGTRVSLSAKGNGALGNPGSLAGEIDGLVVGADTARVLGQLGLPVLPIPDLGPARLSLKLSGALASGADINFDAEAAGTSLNFAGKARAGDGLASGLGLSGVLDVVGADADPLLLMAGIGLAGIGEGHPFQVRGELDIDSRVAHLKLSEGRFNRAPVSGNLAVDFSSGVSISGDLDLTAFSLPVVLAANSGVVPGWPGEGWPDAEFVNGVPDNLDINIGVTSRELDLGFGELARNSSFGLIHRAGRIEIGALKADLAGGRLTGELTSRFRSGEIALALQANIDDAALENLIWRSDGRSVARGRLSGSVNAEAAGRTLSGLVSTLSGNGSFVVTDGIVRAINPNAFTSVIGAHDANPELTPDEISSVFLGFLDAGSLSLGQAEGSLSITSGIVRLASLAIDAGSATAIGDAAVDLNTMILDSDWSLKVDPGADRVTGAEPEVGLVFSGPLAAPLRSVDVNPLVGYLTVRAFEREVERIETLQSDILEKERLGRTLKQFKEEAIRRQIAAAKAERDRIEAEKAAAEAARLAAEEAERQRIAAEKAAAEAARQAAKEAEEKRIAEEKAAAEAARIAAEQEAARKELEKQRAAAEAERRKLEEARSAAEAARLAAEEAARKAEEEAARIAAAREEERRQLEAERAAAQAERQRLEEERAAAEEAKRAAEEAARRVAEEDARLAAEREAERQQLAAERAAAEAERQQLEQAREAAEQARLAYQAAAEKARQDAAQRAAVIESELAALAGERAAAEAERQRMEAERATAEQARLAAEAEAAAAKDEDARQAAEAQAARQRLQEELAAAEAERLRLAQERSKAEEARIAAAEAALKAEEDAKVRAAERERARLALEEKFRQSEAERIRLEREREAMRAARIDAEEAARRADQETARIAAEREVLRLRIEEERAAAEAEKASLAEEAARVEAAKQAAREAELRRQEAATAQAAQDEAERARLEAEAAADAEAAAEVEAERRRKAEEEAAQSADDQPAEGIEGLIRNNRIDTGPSTTGTTDVPPLQQTEYRGLLEDLRPSVTDEPATDGPLELLREYPLRATPLREAPPLR